MKQATATPSKNYEAAKQQCRANTPLATIEMIARQMDRADEAHERIVREGSVVRDMKGSVIAHPAIAVEKDAAKIIVDLIGRYATPHKP